MAFNYADKLRLRLYGGCLLTQPPQHFKIEMLLEKINFEMQYISKLSFCQKMRFSAEPAPRCGALHSCAASEHLNFSKLKCSGAGAP